MNATKADILRRLKVASFWCFVVVVVVPLCWGLLGLLANQVSPEIGSVLLIPLFFYSWPPTAVFGSEHFILHGCCLPSDWVGLAQVVGFYTIVAAIAGSAVGTIQAVRLSGAKHGKIG